jgi:O-antigen ligase
VAFGLTLLYVTLNFLSIADTFPDLADYRIQLIIGILAVIATLPALLFTREVRPGRQAALMAGFTGWVLVSSLPHGGFGGLLVALQNSTQLAAVFFLTALNVRSVKQLKILRLCLLAVTLYLLGRGLYDYMWNPNHSAFVFVRGGGAAGLSWRLQALGLLHDPNAFAQYLLAILPLLFVGAVGRGWRARILVLLPGSALVLAGLWCTHSRGGLVGLAVLVGLLARRRLTVFGGALASAAVATLMLVLGYTGGRYGDDRLNIWSDGLGMFKSSPIWGVGYQRYTYFSDKTAHNSFLLCAVELGLIGCFLWVGVILVSLWELRLVADVTSTRDSDEELRAWANAVLLSLVAFLVPGWFLSETYATMLYLLLGMSAAIARLEIERTGTELLPAVNHWALKTALVCVASMTLVYVMVRSRVF